jgi:hypothetical protein
VYIDEREMKKKHALQIGIFISFILLLISCGGPTVDQATPQQTVTVSPKFQSQLSPIPTPPTYRCGAWSSNNAPGPNSTITIYARLTKDLVGVGGATASAVVHFQGNDQALDQHPTSDTGGYVSFTLPLQGQQPANIPATVDVTFTNFPGGTLHCSQAFFTPQ